MQSHDFSKAPGANQPSVSGTTHATARLPHADTTRTIIGALYEVHGTLGSGFLESVYANSLVVELNAAGLRSERHVPFEIVYRGQPVGRYIADLIVESKVVVEVKAVRAIEAAHRAQLLNYLRASGLEVGLLLNFGASAQFKRVVYAAQRRGRVSSAI